MLRRINAFFSGLLMISAIGFSIAAVFNHWSTGYEYSTVDTFFMGVATLTLLSIGARIKA